MDIPRRKNRLVFPRDCEKLSVEDCEHPKIDNRCKIKYARFGGKNVCIPNETYLLDNEIRKKGFKDFAKLDEENLQADLEKRQEMCKSLTPNACRSPQAKVLGCEYKSGYFKKGRCSLADKIIKYYYRIDKKCLYKGCNEDKQTGFKLCEMHRLEFNDSIEELNLLYDLILDGENIEENYEQFVTAYNELLDLYSIYLVENPGTLVALTEKYNDIRVFLGEDHCQCINIDTCKGSGQVGEFCQNKGIKTTYGLMCPKHRACYKDRKKKYLELKKTFQKLCGLKSCKEELKELESFYKMILFVSEGEALQTKREIMDYLFIIKQYIKEHS